MKLTINDLTKQINCTQYISIDLLTICVLTLTSGFKAVGYSSCLSEENYDHKIGREIAYQNALEHLWELEGYRLKHNSASWPEVRPFDPSEVKE